MIKLGITKDMALRMIRNHTKLTEKILTNSEALKELIEEGRVKQIDEWYEIVETDEEREEREKREAEELERLTKTSREQKTAEIDRYDKSAAVNGFTFAGQKMWFDKNERSAIRHGVESCEGSGMETYSIWYGGKEYTLPTAVCRQMLNAVEIYAIRCFDTTERHKANVAALQTLEEIENYNYREGYPEPLNFDSI